MYMYVASSLDNADTAVTIRQAHTVLQFFRFPGTEKLYAPLAIDLG